MYGFTLIELLVVIAVAGILAALAVPAVKEFGRSNQQVAATRVVLNGVARARQLAIANRTTVYMVFLPNGYLTQSAFSSLPPAYQTQALKLAGGQGRSYALISLRSIGAQPGQSQPQYLSEWTTLPQGWILAPSKFALRSVAPLNYSIGSGGFLVSGFQRTTDDPANPLRLPFPSADAPLPPPGSEWILPYLAFDYQGQLLSGEDEFIPLARGTVEPVMDAAGKFTPSAATIEEFPLGNSLDVVNLIHIDWLTGRSRLEERKIE
jgi:prepilin-type N-terminal cleavage/methylation domain-containing protein